MRSWRRQTSSTKLLHVSFNRYWLRVPFSALTPLCPPILLCSTPTSPLCPPILLCSAPTSPLCPPTCCLGSGRIYPGKEMSPNRKVATQGTRALSGGAAARSPAAVSPSTPSAAHHWPPVGGVKVCWHGHVWLTRTLPPDWNLQTTAPSPAYIYVVAFAALDRTIGLRFASGVHVFTFLVPRCIVLDVTVLQYTFCDMVSLTHKPWPILKLLPPTQTEYCRCLLVSTAHRPCC